MVSVECARAWRDEHIVHRFDPRIVVRGGFVFRGSVGVAVDLDEDEARGIVLLLEEFEAGDAGFPGAVFRVDYGGGFEGIDEFGFDLGVDDQSLHSSSLRLGGLFLEAATMIRSVCVYCASSERSPAVYLDAAERLGGILAEQGITLVYGGGALGSMGRLAKGALAAGGKVIGVLPRFMDELEWGNRGLTELRIVEDMHERKRVMLELSDAAIALPGGCGTLEELFEAITWKRLGTLLRPGGAGQRERVFRSRASRCSTAV